MMMSSGTPPSDIVKTKRNTFAKLVHDMTDKDFRKLLQKFLKLFAKNKTTFEKSLQNLLLSNCLGVYRSREPGRRCQHGGVPKRWCGANEELKKVHTE